MVQIVSSLSLSLFDLQKNLKQFDIEYPRVSSFLHKATRGNVEPVEAFTTSFVPHSMTDYAAIGGVATAVVDIVGLSVVAIIDIIKFITQG